MRRFATLWLPGLLGIAMLAACAKGDEEAATDSAAAEVSDAAASDTASPDGDAPTGGPENHVDVELKVTGGGAPGTYTLRAAPGVCSEPKFTTEDDASGGTYMSDVNEEMKKLPINYISVATEDLAAARASGTRKFRFTALMPGPQGPQTGEQYVIRPELGNGTGTLRVSGEEPNLTFHVSGTLKPATGVEATIVCKP